MSYVDIIICIGSLPILETWPPIYRGQERTVGDRLKASQVYTHVYFRYTHCLTDFTFEFIRRPVSPILSPSSRIFVELTLVNDLDEKRAHVSSHTIKCESCHESVCCQIENKWGSCSRDVSYISYTRIIPVRCYGFILIWIVCAFKLLPQVYSYVNRVCLRAIAASALVCHFLSWYFYLVTSRNKQCKIHCLTISNSK
jgi:hypothetical protein